jgi:dTDP-glucose 4,6-dehydratase
VDKNRKVLSKGLGQVQNHISSTEKAERLLGFKASTNFDKGLKETIEWYINNKPLWQKQIPLRKVPVRLKDGRVVWY